MKQKEFKLIDSTYEVDEANEVLSSLITDKIQFINKKIFRIYERDGSKSMHLKKRITELNRDAKQLVSLLNKFKDKDYEVEIDCEVKVKIKKADLVH